MDRTGDRIPAAPPRRCERILLKHHRVLTAACVSEISQNRLAEHAEYAERKKGVAECQSERCSIVRQLVLHHDDGPDGFAALHQIEAFVELLQLQTVSDQRVERDLLVHIPIDDL